MSGQNGPGSTKYTNVEEWNGSAWTEIADVNATRSIAGSSGNVTSALFFAGEGPSLSAATELWNGSSWAEINDLSTARGDTSGLGSNILALCSGGATPSLSSATEEFTADITNTTITSS